LAYDAFISARDRCGGAQRADCGVAVRGQFEILRAFADRDRAVKPMTVFGDPLFDPSRSGGDKRDYRWCVAAEFCLGRSEL
jgi:hypothetical protein